MKKLLEWHWKLGMTHLIHNLLQLYKRFSFPSYLMITVAQTVYPKLLKFHGNTTLLTKQRLGEQIADGWY